MNIKVDHISGGRYIKGLNHENYLKMYKYQWGPEYWNYLHYLAILFSNSPSVKKMR